MILSRCWIIKIFLSDAEGLMPMVIWPQFAGFFRPLNGRHFCRSDMDKRLEGEGLGSPFPHTSFSHDPGSDMVSVEVDLNSQEEDVDVS